MDWPAQAGAAALGIALTQGSLFEVAGDVRDDISASRRLLCPLLAVLAGWSRCAAGAVNAPWLSQGELETKGWI